MRFISGLGVQVNVKARAEYFDREFLSTSSLSVLRNKESTLAQVLGVLEIPVIRRLVTINYKGLNHWNRVWGILSHN